MHDLCVVIVCYDGGRWLNPALASVFKHAGGLALDVVVADCSSDGSAEHIEERFRDVRVIRCSSPGSGYAKNRALETANARFALFLTADMEILEGSIGALISVLEDRPRVALVGARQLCRDGTLASSIRRFPSGLHTLAEALGIEKLPGVGRILGERELDVRQYDRERPCEWTSGFMLVRATALDSVGWFDERFAFHSDDADLCWRLKRAGWEIVHTPRVTIRGDQPSRRENAWLEAHSAYARMQFARKHFPRVAAEYRWALALGYALRVGLYSLLPRHASNRRQAARAALTTVLRGRAPLEEQSAPL